MSEATCNPLAAEHRRLAEANAGGVAWRGWGPYLSERQWGTVREDYSRNGAAWEYFSHDQARSRAYRWGEDGIAGICDDRQRLCFAVAFWNGADPILKERLFGLTNNEGNHGEDVKECYFYLDNTPTHSFMRMLYKYPQRAYPYDQLVRVNRARPRTEPEFELIDTGIFDDQRYFDIEVTYAKASPKDILVEITATNRGPDAALLHLLPTLWFRNTWSWGDGSPRPTIRRDGVLARAAHPEMGDYALACDAPAAMLFTENETNAGLLFGAPSAQRYAKDGIGTAVVHGRADAVNPAQVGSKMAWHAHLSVNAGETARVRLRLTHDAAPADPFGATFADVLARRREEADEFYRALLPPAADEDARLIMRQALAGMLWSKQFYFLDQQTWLREHAAEPATAATSGARNAGWSHLLNSDVISMPDKWEYPWYAAWDLGFQALVLALVDSEFAKQQLELMLRGDYLHPNGQMPAYEWNFGDVNPPVHAWACLYAYEIERLRSGAGDRGFLERAFSKLLMNFTWWVNRKDPTGRNAFEGGFLGLDNIGVFDRSAPLPTGGRLEQADGTAWMAIFCQSMLEIAVHLATEDPNYEDLAVHFVEHFCRIASALNGLDRSEDGMWDEADGFYYDLLRLPDASAQRLKTRSLVGLLPLCATVVVEESALERFPRLTGHLQSFLRRHPHLSGGMAPVDRRGVNGRRMLALLDERKLRRVLARMLDPDEFFGDFGIRSLSRAHRDHPYIVRAGDADYHVEYEPAESCSGLFGGNSNWRGPVWFPVNALLLRALRQSYLFYGDAFTVECPTGSGVQRTLYEVSEMLAQRLIAIFRRGADGQRPVFGGAEIFQSDPHWRDNLLFYEYFHGDNGAGIGASHQTGWTGLVALAIALYGGGGAADFLERGTIAAMSALAGIGKEHRLPGR